ncbi:B3 domain-containing protein [Forsythia ovata]|uniref:B3 domain-containing protein n=1 Tax=Forsythia ovata TaxID=205694 RepID=A0ABD1QTH8_9LAMI
MYISSTAPEDVDRTPRPEPALSSFAMTDLDEEGITPLRGEPFYDLKLSKSHIQPTYHMSFPPTLDSALPSATVPAIIRCFGKTWEVKFCGGRRPKCFDSSWRKLVDDNNLVTGDFLVFELLESTSIKVVFEVQILRCAIPPELQELRNKRKTEKTDSSVTVIYSRTLTATAIYDLDKEEITPLIGEPFYDLVLSKSHIHPVYDMSFPPALDSLLPSTTVPLIIRCFGKTWEVKFCGERRPKGFDSSWRKFVDDSNLVAGDALVFELLESTSVKVMFKVQILRCTIPPELQELINKRKAEFELQELKNKGKAKSEIIIIDDDE